MSTNRFAIVTLATNIVDGVSVGQPYVPPTKIALEVLEGERVGPEFRYHPGEVPRFTAPPEEPPPEDPPAE